MTEQITRRDVEQPPAAYTHREVLTGLSGLLVAMFVAILSGTIVSNALPTIVGDLHGSQTGYTWVVTATLLATTVSTPVWGKLADLMSKKLLIQSAIAIFIVGSVGAGLAGSLDSLIAWRGVQGIGAGGLQSLAQVIMAVLIPPRERGRYSGYFGATLAAATVSGPLVGGLLVDTPGLGWRWCFFIGVPVGLVALAVLQRNLRIPAPTRDTHGRLDLPGAALLTGGVSALLVWVSLAGTQFAWSSGESLVLAGLGLAALAAGILVELRAAEPMVPMSLFTERTVTLAVLASATVGMVLYGGTVFLGQYFQTARSFNPTVAGLLSLPMVVGMVAASTVSGQLISRYGRWKPYLVTGAVLISGSLALLATIDHTTPVPEICGFLLLLGIGVGLSMQNLVLAVQNTVGLRNMGAASSLVTFLRSMGGTVGVTVLGVVLGTRVSSLLGDGATSLADLATLPPAQAALVRAAYGDGIGLVFTIAAALSLIALVAVVAIKEVPLRTTIDRPGS